MDTVAASSANAELDPTLALSSSSIERGPTGNFLLPVDKLMGQH